MNKNLLFFTISMVSAHHSYAMYPDIMNLDKLYPTVKSRTIYYIDGFWGVCQYTYQHRFHEALVYEHLITTAMAIRKNEAKKKRPPKITSLSISKSASTIVPITAAIIKARLENPSNPPMCPTPSIPEQPSINIFAIRRSRAYLDLLETLGGSIHQSIIETPPPVSNESCSKLWIRRKQRALPSQTSASSSLPPANATPALVAIAQPSAPTARNMNIIDTQTALVPLPSARNQAIIVDNLTPTLLSVSNAEDCTNRCCFFQ